MELTALDIRHFELYFRYGISKTSLAGGYDAVKDQVEKDFPGHTFEEMLGQANRAFEKRKADAEPGKSKRKIKCSYEELDGHPVPGTHNIALLGLYRNMRSCHITRGQMDRFLAELTEYMDRSKRQGIIGLPSD